MDTSKDEVVYLILACCEKLQLKANGRNLLEGLDKEVVLEISHFLQEEIRCWINEIKKVLGNRDLSGPQLDETKLPLLWGIIHCYPHFVNAQEEASLLVDLVDVVDQLLVAKSGIFLASVFCIVSADALGMVCVFKCYILS